MERLAHYMARPPISLSKVTLEEQGANVLFHTKYQPLLPTKPQALRGDRLHRRADTTPATQRGALHPSCGTPLATAAGCTHHAHVPPFGRATAPPGSAVPTSCAFRRFPRHHLRARITPRALKSFEYRRASSTWARLIAKIYGVDPQGGSPSGSESRGGESPLICPRCGKSMRVLAIITDPGSAPVE